MHKENVSAFEDVCLYLCLKFKAQAPSFKTNLILKCLSLRPSFPNELTIYIGQIKAGNFLGITHPFKVILTIPLECCHARRSRHLVIVNKDFQNLLIVLSLSLF